MHATPQTAITPETLLRGYAMGVFPMAESRVGTEIRWIDPLRRGVIPLAGFHISRSLGRALLRPDHTVTTDTDFGAVVDGCADRDDTWINAEIRALYLALHRAGYAHSIEVRALSGALVGGVYGVTLGGAFFGESMFSRRTDASKIALAWCVDRLVAGGYTLFDTQFLTPHLASLGAEEIPRAAYHRRLVAALRISATWTPAGYAPDAYSVRQRRTQTS